MPQSSEIPTPISCLGISLRKGEPLKRPVFVTIGKTPEGTPEVQGCRFLSETICTAAELSARTNCVQLPFERSSESINSLPALGSQEKNVLTYMAKGLTAKSIGDAMYLAVATVKTYQRNIYNKYSAPEGAHAVVIGIVKGEIDRDKLAADFDLTKASDLDTRKWTVLRELSNVYVLGTNKAIGQRVALSEDTVKQELSVMFKRHGLVNRNRAAAFYLLAEHAGLIPQVI